MTRHVTDEDDPHFWIGYLTSAIDNALRDPDGAQRILRHAARDVAAAPILTPELRRQLIHTLERKKARV